MFLDCQDAECKFIADFNRCLPGSSGRTITKKELENLFKTEYKEHLDKPENKAVKEEIDGKISALGDQVNLKEFFDCVRPLYAACADAFKK